MEQKLEKYARLVVRKGVNIEKNQILVINSPIECADFARKANVFYCFNHEKLL